MTQEQALLGGLLSAFMWGSWGIAVKKLKHYPLDAFLITLYVVSFLAVWIIAIVYMGSGLFTEIFQAWQTQSSIIIVALVVGAIFIQGVRITLMVFSSIGLAVTAPIQTFNSLVLGTTMAVLVGGTAPGISLLDLAIVCIVFLLASMATIWARLVYNASQNRNMTQQSTEYTNTTTNDNIQIVRGILLTIISSLIVTAYPLGLAFSLRTPSREFGLTPLTYMALLVTGSLLGALVTSGSVLTVRRQWSTLFVTPWRIYRYGIISAGAHYGGNIINTFATGALTASLSWPLGTTSYLWTYVWGLATGEFKNAPRRSYMLIGVGAILFIVGMIYLRLALVGST